MIATAIINSISEKPDSFFFTENPATPGLLATATPHRSKIGIFTRQIGGA